MKTYTPDDSFVTGIYTQMIEEAGKDPKKHETDFLTKQAADRFLGQGEAQKRQSRLAELKAQIAKLQSEVNELEK